MIHEMLPSHCIYCAEPTTEFYRCPDHRSYPLPVVFDPAIQLYCSFCTYPLRQLDTYEGVYRSYQYFCTGCLAVTQNPYFDHREVLPAEFTHYMARLYQLSYTLPSYITTAYKRQIAAFNDGKMIIFDAAAEQHKS